MIEHFPVQADALRLFVTRFLNRTDRVAIVAPWGKPTPITTPDLEALLAAHVVGAAVRAAPVIARNRRGTTAMSGRYRVGSYCPGPDNATRWLCLDFDGAGHAGALVDPQAAALAAHAAFTGAGLPAYLERSGGGKGFHLWCFFEPAIPAGDAMRLGRALAPTDALLTDGTVADVRSMRGIEVFPKQAKVRRNQGFGNLVWLPWWSGAAEGGNVFYRVVAPATVAAGATLEPFVPTELDTAPPAALAEILAHFPVVPPALASPPTPARRAPTPRGDRAPRERTPAAPATITLADRGWSEWRHDALAAVSLERIYGEWLTGNAAGEGWLECRDPWSPSGDVNPSASVADGSGDAERGTFHSFRDGRTLSLFDFLVEHGDAADFRAARARVALESGVPWPAPAVDDGSDPFEDMPADAGGESAALPALPSAPPAAAAIATVVTAAPPVAVGAATVGRPEVQVNLRQVRAVLADAWHLVIAANRPEPTVFVRNGQLVRLAVQPKKPDVPRVIEAMSEISAYARLVEIADWVTLTPNGTMHARPPFDVARIMVDSPSAALPALDAVVAAPVFAADGSLVRTPGYHAGARVWYQPPLGFDVPPVPEHPTVADLADAKHWFFDELLVNFPFVDAGARANMIAALLLPFARRLIAGPTPIHLFEAPTQGSGKGLLASTVAMLVLGTGAEGSSLPTEDDEVRKKLGAELMTGSPLLMLDNADARRTLDSSALASAVTMWPTWKDRLLGQSKMFSAPNEAMWILTGNNPRLSGELARRCISIRIDSGTDRPWLRSGFLHEDHLEWTYKQRAPLVHAALVLIQNWIARGRPDGRARLGSFERWAATMGGILAAADIPGFMSNLEALYASADAENATWRDFVSVWWETHGDQPVRVSDLAKLCVEHEVMASVLGTGSDRSQATKLGHALTAARGRVFGTHRIGTSERDRTSKRPVYRLARADAATAVHALPPQSLLPLETRHDRTEPSEALAVATGYDAPEADAALDDDDA